MKFVFFVLLFIYGHLTLDCYIGTNDNLQTCTADPSLGQECISASFKASAAPSTTKIFTCGSCAAFSNPQLASTYSNVTCCNSTDFCLQTTGTPSPNGTCDFITDQDSCQLRSDCYWCGGSPTTTLNGFGLCKSFVGFALGPCWALPLVLPTPICETIDCKPANPPYSAENLTLEFLLDFGFAPIPKNTSIIIGLDVLTRLSQTRILNNTYEFCETDYELQEWCGFNHSTPFRYCLVSETWPQTDISGWMQNTTFSSPRNLVPLWPSFCACSIPGRAYYVPYRYNAESVIKKVPVALNYGPACDAEHAALAFLILLVLCTILSFIYVLWDTALLLTLSFKNKKKGFYLGKTFPVKILIIFYFLVTIPNQILFIIPNIEIVIGGVLKLLGIVFLLFAFVLASFAFIEILLEAKLFGEQKKIVVAINIYKWTFLAVFGFLLVCCIGLLSANAFYLQKVDEFRDTNLADFQQTTKNISSLFKTVLLLLISCEFLMIVLTAILLIFVTYSLVNVSSGSRVRGLKDLIARDLALIFSTIISIPHLGILCTIAVYNSWIVLGDIPSPQPTKYTTTYAFTWLTWAAFVTELIWIMATAYAMRTVVKKSWLVAQFKSMFSIETGSQSSGNLSSGSATQNEKTFESRL